MGAYLIDHPPAVQQFYRSRRLPLTGATVLHTAESVMDTVGPDTGAEAVAAFIRGRSTPGSYHDLVDSDSWLRVVPLESAAFQDGTGSNNWALSISFACSTTDWARMSPERRAAFLRQGARAFADQQAWRRAHGAPVTELRRITKAQSDAGASGFVYHGDRDPGRRSDPGKNPPNEFPIDEFITHCRAALAGTDLPEDDMQQPEITALHNADANSYEARLASASARDEARAANARLVELHAILVAQAAQGSDLTEAQIRDAAETGARDGARAVLTAAVDDLTAAIDTALRADNADAADKAVAIIRDRLAATAA